jgi:hypothetical protein
MPLQRMQSRVNEVISVSQTMAYTRQSNGQAFQPARWQRALPRIREPRWDV